MSATHVTESPPARYHVAGMDCGNCALTVEKGVAALAGVDDVAVNFATGLMEVRGSVERGLLAARLAELGYRLVDDHGAALAPGDADLPELHGVGGFARYLWRARTTRLALLGGAALLVALPWLWAAVPGSAAATAFTAVCGLVALIAGFPVARKGLRSLVYARRID